MSKRVDALTNYINYGLKKLEKDGAVVGISGGLDSAVVLRLCQRAIGNGKIRAIALPEFDSDPESVRLAKELCAGLSFEVINIGPVLKKLGIYRYFHPMVFSLHLPYRIKKNYVHRISPSLKGRLYLKFLRDDLPEDLKKIKPYLRIKNRIRMTILYQKAEELNYGVVGTINRTEYLLGFFVPFGDGSADIMPLIDLYKTEVRELALELKIPPAILNRKPSPDLIPGLGDEEIIGLKYERIDTILKKIVAGERTTGEERYIKEVYEAAASIRRLIAPKPEKIFK